MQWTGEPDEFTAWLADNGYLWRIQHPQPEDVKAHEERESVHQEANAMSLFCNDPVPVLFIVTDRPYGHMVIRPGDWAVRITVADKLSLTTYSDTHFREEYVV